MASQPKPGRQECLQPAEGGFLEKKWFGWLFHILFAVYAMGGFFLWEYVHDKVLLMNKVTARFGLQWQLPTSPPPLSWMSCELDLPGNIYITPVYLWGLLIFLPAMLLMPEIIKRVGNYWLPRNPYWRSGLVAGGLVGILAWPISFSPALDPLAFFISTVFGASFIGVTYALYQQPLKPRYLNEAPAYDDKVICQLLRNEAEKWWRFSTLWFPLTLAVVVAGLFSTSISPPLEIGFAETAEEKRLIREFILARGLAFGLSTACLVVLTLAMVLNIGIRLTYLHNSLEDYLKLGIQGGGSP